MYLIVNAEAAIPLLIPRFCNLGDADDSFNQLITINSTKTASTHEKFKLGICYPEDSRILRHWTVSGTDYPSVTTNLHRSGTSSSLWYLWGTNKWSAEAEAAKVMSDILDIEMQAVRERVASSSSSSSHFICHKHVNMKWLAVWLSGNALASINVVALRQTRLVLGWVTVCGRVNHFGM